MNGIVKCLITENPKNFVIIKDTQEIVIFDTENGQHDMEVFCAHLQEDSYVAYCKAESMGSYGCIVCGS